MRLLRVAAVLAGLACAIAQPAGAQTDLTFRDTPLADALYQLSERTGVEIVFATRLAGPMRVTGRYATDDPDRALRLMLRGSGIRAERIRAGQYVLIAVPPTVAAGVEDDPKSYTGALEGRVVDAETNEGLAAAHVWLVDLGLGDIVDAGGSFLVPDLPAGRYTVRVSHIGYRPVRVELDVFPDSPRLPPTIRLQPEPIASADAEVMAGPSDTGSAPGVTDLEARGASAPPVVFGEGDLAAALSWLPGLSRAGGGSGPLVVRGAEPYQMRTVRDGAPVFEPWHASGLASVFQPEALSRVRFYRGTLPASLGGALAGVLDVESTDALAGDTVATVALSPLAARAVADVALGRTAGLHIGLRRSTLGVLRRPRLGTGGRAARGDGLLVLDPWGRRGDSTATVAFGDAEAKLSLRLGSRLRLDGGFFGASNRIAAHPPAGADRLDYRWTGITGSARLRALVDERTFVTAVTYRAGHHAREARATGGVSQTVTQTLVETGLEVHLDHFLTSRHQLQGGVGLALRRIAGADAAGESRTRGGDLALFAMDTWTPSQPWQVQPGVRVELVTDGDRLAHVQVSPRLSARWSPVEDRLVVRAGFGRQTQTLHRVYARAGDRYLLSAMRWLAAGRHVMPGTAWQAGAGAEWAASSRVALSVDVYGRQAEGMPLSLEGAAAGREPGVSPATLAARFPTHRGRAGGIELAARVEAGTWVLGLSAAAARAEVSPSGAPQVRWRAAPYDRPLAAGLLAERRAERLSLAVRVDVQSGFRLADGYRAPADVQAGAAIGLRQRVAGVAWHLLAQAVIQPFGASVPMAADGAVGWPLATDFSSVPALPLVSLTGRW